MLQLLLVFSAVCAMSFGSAVPSGQLFGQLPVPFTDLAQALPTAISNIMAIDFTKLIVIIIVIACIIAYAPSTLATLNARPQGRALKSEESHQDLQVYGQNMADTWFIVYKALERYASSNAQSIQTCMRLAACNTAKHAQTDVKSGKPFRINTLFSKFLDSNYINVTEYMGMKKVLLLGKDGGNCASAYDDCPTIFASPVQYLLSFWTAPKSAHES